MAQKIYSGPEEYAKATPYLVVVHTANGPEIHRACGTKKLADALYDRLSVSVQAEVMTRRKYEKRYAC